MKKLLLATTALVMGSTGFAMAEVKVSGTARLGMVYNGAAENCSVVDAQDDGECETITGYDSALNVVNRVRIIFDVSGQTDAGLSYGATIRADQSDEGNDDGSTDVGELWVEGAYGRIAVGDVDTALENAVGDLPSRSLTGLGDNNEFWYPDNSADQDGGILYTYKLGDSRFYASYQDQYIGETAVEKSNATWSVGAGAKAGGYDFGLGYASTEDLSETWGISGGGSLAGVTLKAAYIVTQYDNDAAQDMKQYGLGGEYKMANGVGVSAWWKEVKNNLGVADDDYKAFGVGADYDLGGGVTVAGGIGSTDLTGDDELLADFGLKFAF